MLEPLQLDKESDTHFQDMGGEPCFELMLQYLFDMSCGVKENRRASPEELKQQLEKQRQLKVHHVNELLNELVAVDSDKDKVAVLRQLVEKTTPTMMKWIVHIILKDLKVRAGGCCSEPCAPKAQALEPQMSHMGRWQCCGS